MKFQKAEKDLRESPFSFQFFQAVRLLQLISRRQPVGGTASPEREAIRFIARRSLAFPASEVHSIRPRPDGISAAELRRLLADGETDSIGTVPGSDVQGTDVPVFTGEVLPIMCVNFMGLTGPSGVLPWRYSEELIDRALRGDYCLEVFLNMFNHRMISFFYRGWEKYRFHVAIERGVENDVFSSSLKALIGTVPNDAAAGDETVRRAASRGAPPGVGTPEEKPWSVSDPSLLFYAGLLMLKSRPVTAVRSLIADYFGVQVEIEQFTGEWFTLNTGSQCRMNGEGSLSEQLGIGSIIGDEVWNPQSRALIRLGPLSQRRYEQFLPDGGAFKALRALLQLLFGQETGFDLRLILAKEEVPQSLLDGTPFQLGWMTWMNSRAGFDRNPGDTILALN